ncbi:hypothetical protein L1887_51217 [Cichorium endivia]|nr:hypothetical protein L1887_51217 [Cichorium endivia]
MLGGLALELRRDRFGERAYGQSGDLCCRHAAEQMVRRWARKGDRARVKLRGGGGFSKGPCELPSRPNRARLSPAISLHCEGSRFDTIIQIARSGDFRSGRQMQPLEPDPTTPPSSLSDTCRVQSKRISVAIHPHQPRTVLRRQSVPKPKKVSRTAREIR